MTKVEFCDKPTNLLGLQFYSLNFSIFIAGLRILAFPCNQFASQMPEGDGDEMVCHLKQQNAEIGDVFAKVNTFYNFHLKVNKND